MRLLLAPTPSSALFVGLIALITAQSASPAIAAAIRAPAHDAQALLRRDIPAPANVEQNYPVRGYKRDDADAAASSPSPIAVEKNFGLMRPWVKRDGSDDDSDSDVEKNYGMMRGYKKRQDDNDDVDASTRTSTGTDGVEAKWGMNRAWVKRVGDEVEEQEQGPGIDGVEGNWGISRGFVKRQGENQGTAGTEANWGMQRGFVKRDDSAGDDQEGTMNGKGGWGLMRPYAKREDESTSGTAGVESNWGMNRGFAKRDDDASSAGTAGVESNWGMNRGFHKRLRVKKDLIGDLLGGGSDDETPSDSGSSTETTQDDEANPVEGTEAKWGAGARGRGW